MMVQNAATPETTYGRMQKILHWIVAGLLAGNFAIAWSMPDIHRDTKPEGLIRLHLAVGTVILLVAILRLLWRFRQPVPVFSGQAPPWQQRAAQATHSLLYLLLLVLPIMGWANASYRGWTIDLFGWGHLPQIVPTGSPLGRPLGDVHTVIAYVLLGLIGLHLAAALYHQFWLRDQIMSRMLPSR